jgi:quercetin dioxygenase-like cupin family protein
MARAWDARRGPISLQFSPLDGLSAGHEEERMNARMKTIVSVLTAAAILTSAPRVVRAQSHNHVIQTPQEAQWGPAPPMLPAGAQIAVLAGDPTKPVPYAVRLKFPASYAIPAHSHPTDEHVVVLSGALTFGMGDALNKGAAANKTLAVGGFALMPAQMNHFAYTTGQETTIVLYGQGPVEFKYVNPTDDPRYGKKGTD